MKRPRQNKRAVHRLHERIIGLINRTVIPRSLLKRSKPVIMRASCDVFFWYEAKKMRPAELCDAPTGCPDKVVVGRHFIISNADTLLKLEFRRAHVRLWANLPRPSVRGGSWGVARSAMRFEQHPKPLCPETDMHPFRQKVKLYGAKLEAAKLHRANMEVET